MNLPIVRSHMHVHAHDPQLLTQPKKRPSSPFTGKSLKLKDLIPVKFSLDDARKPLCAVSQKQITTQPVVLIRTYVPRPPGCLPDEFAV